MPKTCEYSFLHISEFSACIEHQQILPEVAIPEATRIIDRIGQYVAMLVEDGATLQLGIGKIPDAVTRYLQHHKKSRRSFGNNQRRSRRFDSEWYCE